MSKASLVGSLLRSLGLNNIEGVWSRKSQISFPFGDGSVSTSSDSPLIAYSRILDILFERVAHFLKGLASRGYKVCKCLFENLRRFCFGRR
jgi:hypothetical protein